MQGGEKGLLLGSTSELYGEVMTQAGGMAVSDMGTLNQG